PPGSGQGIAQACLTTSPLRGWQSPAPCTRPSAPRGSAVACSSASPGGPSRQGFHQVAWSRPSSVIDRHPDPPQTRSGHTPASYSGQERRQPIRPPLEDLLAGARATGGMEGDRGLAGQTPATAARTLSSLPTDDPGRGAPRTAAPGWPPAAASMGESG